MPQKSLSLLMVQLRMLATVTERGFDIAFSGDGQSVAYWGNYTTVSSEIVKTSDDNQANEGNELRSIPEFTSSLGVKYFFNEQLEFRVHLDSQGDYYVNEANEGGKFGGYSIVNAGARYSKEWGSVDLQINNLTDEYYERVHDFSEDGTSTTHSPGDGVNGTISLSLNL